MKKIIPSLIAFLFCVSFTTTTSAQSPDDPGAYMNSISNAKAEMNQKYMAYLSASAHSSRKRKIDKMRIQALESITNSKFKTIDLPYFKGDNTLRQSSIDYIKFCYNIFNDDYSKIVNMEEIAERSFDEMEAYLLLQEKADEKIKEVNETMDQATKVFAAKYNVKIIESQDELGNKMSDAGKLNRYRNNIYLIFFKCFWQDGEIIKAMNTGKVTTVEQGRNSLIRFADEGLQTLDTLKGFAGDPTLATTCKQVLKFYKNMAEKDLPKQTDYYLKKESFEKMDKAFNQLPAKDRTKESVAAYNKAVGELNGATNTFNNTNNKINSERDSALKLYNETEKNFIDTHMPHYK